MEMSLSAFPDLLFLLPCPAWVSLAVVTGAGEQLSPRPSSRAALAQRVALPQTDEPALGGSQQNAGCGTAAQQPSQRGFRSTKWV